MERESSESSPKFDRRLFLPVASAALVGTTVFLLASYLHDGLGFPLDDSWIHSTYARNLALAGQWAFQLGRPSAGSTAPLYTVLMAPGFLIGLGPLWWSYLLGIASLVVLGGVAETILRRVDAAYEPRMPWAGVLVVLEWHMLWAATSGMETLLHALLATLVLGLLMTRNRNFAAIGLLMGLGVWIRPDALTLAAPALLAAWQAEPHAPGSRFRRLLSLGLGVGALFLPYLVVNLLLSGTPMPNTFYAKQAEYSAWQAQSITLRAGIGLAQLSTGPMLLLWPGLAATVVRTIRTRDFTIGLAVAWTMGYVGLYLMRLPAYQHGRYLMPAIPMLLLLSLLGYMELHRSLANQRRGWVLVLAWPWALSLLTLGFVLLGARAYADDVALIESEMVVTANWVANNVPEGAVVAAHDIGALGYFDQHPLIDLAGLVSPEVIPFIRDEDELARFLDQGGAKYLVAFPHLYPELARQSRIIFESGAPFAPPGFGNMTVYCWRCP